MCPFYFPSFSFHFSLWLLRFLLLNSPSRFLRSIISVFSCLVPRDLFFCSFLRDFFFFWIFAFYSRFLELSWLFLTIWISVTLSSTASFFSFSLLTDFNFSVLRSTALRLSSSLDFDFLLFFPLPQPCCSPPLWILIFYSPFHPPHALICLSFVCSEESGKNHASCPDWSSGPPGNTRAIINLKVNVMRSLLYQNERLGEGGVITAPGVHPPRNFGFTP